MAEFFGLSHLIFSSPNRALVNNSPLLDVYGAPETFTLDHAEAKRDMLRNAGDATRLTLYNAKGALPALELIQTPSTTVSRPSCSYGLIMDKLGEGYPDMALGRLDAVARAIGADSAVMAEDIPAPILIAPDRLLGANATMGAWTVTDDLERDARFFEDIIGARRMAYKDNAAFYVMKTVNRQFSTFLWVLIEDAAAIGAEGFRYDDTGLVGAGWFAKKLTKLKSKLPEGYLSSPEFDIDMGAKRFRAMFAYEGKNLAHEALTLRKDA